MSSADLAHRARRSRQLTDWLIDLRPSPYEPNRTESNRNTEPQASILGSPDLAVRLGAPINLTCVISQSPDQLQFVFWYRNERMINYDLDQERRGKIVMSKMGQRPDTILSNLQIFRSKATDSANYTCAPSGARAGWIQVHVVEGK